VTVTEATATISRRVLLACAVSACATATATAALAAPAIRKGAGDIRVINLYNPRTDDRLSGVYWVDGEYVPEMLAEIDHIMRDWRIEQKRRISPALIDIVAATHRLVDSPEPFHLFSGYRSPQTNAMLRKRTRGVARDSYHMRGMAADLHHERRSVRQVALAAASLNAGGIGRYSRSDFVHLDCGPQRDWGR
jgi:uncharacterized protein YcbK (DUF882 family)